MAKQTDVEQLEQGVAKWNAWRFDGSPTPDLSGANLSGVQLYGANLRSANLRSANLTDAGLSGADLTDADLTDADLCDARLYDANLSGARLGGAILKGAYLIGANLIGASLVDAKLWGALLYGANLSGARLGGAHLTFAHLKDANLSGADLTSADLRMTHLSGADLTSADLRMTLLSGANLSGANLSEAHLDGTVFANVDLTSVIGLETCTHHGPSSIDPQTLQKSGSLPLSFLRGVGLPESLIEYLPSLFNQAIRHYSCFISYSTKDQEFAKRLHADLQDKGVRCWFAPHDLPIGVKTWDAIDEAIRLRDKLLLILSKNSIGSDWVEDEVNKAFAEERDRKSKQLVLFPVRIDDAVMETPEPWARKLRDQRNIGDFRRWKDHDAYKESFERVVRNLTIPPKA